MIHENQSHPDEIYNIDEPITTFSTCETNLNNSNTRNKNVLLSPWQVLQVFK